MVIIDGSKTARQLLSDSIQAEAVSLNMPLPSQLDIYKASAGSGKTFLLTIKYLQLLFEQPGNYRHILAVTFTNKATAEMKDRILGELQNLAKGKQTIYGEKLL